MIVQKDVKKWAVITLVLTLVTCLTGCAYAERPKNKIVIYSSMPTEIAKLLELNIDSAFPQYDISIATESDMILHKKVEDEINVKQLECDILIAGDPAYAMMLKEKNILHSYQLSNSSDLVLEGDEQGTWYPLCYTNVVLGYNPSFSTKEELPDSYHEFAYQSSNYACSMANPTTSSSALAILSALKDKYGYGYFEQLSHQNLSIESNSVALTKLEIGESKVALVTEDAVLKKREIENSQIEILYPTDGVISIPVPIMMINDDWSLNRTSKLCEDLVEWLLSEQAQQIIQGSQMYPIRKTIEEPITQQIPIKNMTIINWENCYRQREELLAKFETVVEHSVKIRNN